MLMKSFQVDEQKLACLKLKIRLTNTCSSCAVEELGKNHGIFTHSNCLSSILIILSLARKSCFFFFFFFKLFLSLGVAHIVYWWYIHCMKGLLSPRLHRGFFHSYANSTKDHFGGEWWDTF